MNPELREAYRLMRARHGHLQWWPADSPFEICVGAILTQNTSWKNVERAIANLKEAKALAPRKIYALSHEELAALIRPSGYFNLKARRLRNFVTVLVEQYRANLQQFINADTATVRQRLLAINGIGPETADSMLLFAGDHASFVIDAYTKRIFSRHAWCEDSADYHELQTLCVDLLSQKRGAQRLAYWQDYHAQLVATGHRYCKPRNPDCEACPLQPLLPG